MLTRKGLSVLTALALIGCAEAPSEPSETPLAPLAPSFAVTENVWLDTPPLFSAFNTCGPTPERVLVHGRYHIVSKQKGDKIEVKINTDAFKGVGQTTGNEYVSQVSQYIVEVPTSSFPTATFDVRNRLISRGNADNLFIVSHIVFTLPTFDLIEFTQTSECKG